MSAALSPLPPRDAFEVNLILLDDGRAVHLTDIATAAEGQAILDEVDDGIGRIEAQLARAQDGVGPDDPGWRRRATAALTRKRRHRPRLQQRIAELRRAERQPVPPDPDAPSRKESKRHAFIEAAEAMLEHEVFVEIWARARELHPDAFLAPAGEVAP